MDTLLSFPASLDELDLYTDEADWTFSPCSPRPLLTDDEADARPILRSSICILLSLAVHFTFMAVPGSAPPSAPDLVMELSLAANAVGSGSGTKALPKAGGRQMPAPPNGPSAKMTEPKQVATPPHAPLVHDDPPKKTFSNVTQTKRAPVRTTSRPSRRPQPETRRRPPAPPQEKSDTTGLEENASGRSDNRAEGQNAPAGQTVTGPATNPAASGTGTKDGQGSNGGAGADGPTAGGGQGSSGSAGAGAPLAFGSAEGPSFAFQARPKYPRMAVARREEGTVTLMIHLDAQGRLLDVEIVKSCGPRLDEAALEAARASTYRPAIQAGARQTCRAVLHMRFALRG